MPSMASRILASSLNVAAGQQERDHGADDDDDQPRHLVRVVVARLQLRR